MIQIRSYIMIIIDIIRHADAGIFMSNNIIKVTISSVTINIIVEPFVKDSKVYCENQNFTIYIAYLYSLILI